MSKAFGQHLDELIPQRLAELSIPGVAFALIEHGEVTAIKSYGYADVAQGAPINSDTLFNIASISKAITSWGVMKLVEQKKLDLDTPVEEYLTRWRLPESKFDHRMVTPRRLLSHTAGISTEGIKGIDIALPAVGVLDVLSGDLPPLDAAQLAYCRQWQPEVDTGHQRDSARVTHPPGEAFRYSNLGITLLELMIEEVSGQSFSHFMSEQVLQPLGMSNAGFELMPDSQRCFATPYNHEGKPAINYQLVAQAATGMHATIEDLATFACAELAGPDGEPPGRGVLLPESLETLFGKVIFAESLDGLEFDAALGHFLLDVNGAIAVHHTGGVLGWRSIYLVIPATGVGFVALINSDAGNPLWIQTLQDWAGSL